MTSTPTRYRAAVGGIAALSLALAAVAGTTFLAHQASAAPTLAVTGYAEEGTATGAIDASAPAMATVGVDGININSAGTSAPAPDSGAIALLNRARADNLRAEFLVGNYSATIGDFDPTALDRLVSSTTNIDNVVASLVHDVNAQGWDGVTVDFESILSQDEQGLVDFVTTLKSAMPAGKTVTIDVTAFPNASDYPANGYDLSALGSVVDRVALMAYDEHGPTWNGVGPIGGLPWQEQCLQQVLASVPASKVDFGVAGYGYTWPTTGTGVQVSDAQARQMVQSDGSTAIWDSTQGEWTATLSDGTVMWWSDAKSWPLRVTLAQKYALHGMALWSLGLSDPLPVTTPPSGSTVYEAEAPSSVLVGGATVVACTACSGGARVGYLGGTGTLTMKNIAVATAGSYTITIAYTNGDATSLQIMLSVNGGAKVTFTGAPTADWDTPANATIKLNLAAGNNRILFSNTGTTGDVPDIDKITVPANHN